MSLLIVKSSKALDDLADIWEYIAFGNPTSGDSAAAEKIIIAAEKTFENLAEFPHRKEVLPKGVFLTPVEGFSQYLILYRFDEAMLEVLRVFRSDLDWTRLL